MQPPTQAEQQLIARAFLYDGAPQRLQLYERFMTFYNNIVCPASSDHAVVVPIDNPTFASHAEVVAAVSELRADPTLTHSGWIKRFPACGIQQQDRVAAAHALVRVAFMIDCESQQSHPEGFQVGDFKPRSWQSSEPFIDFVTRAFPSPVAHAELRRVKSLNTDAQRRKLKAWKLKKRYKLKFRPTDNIVEHLLYQDGVVKVFHHTGYLKAHLQRSAAEPLDLGFTESLKLGTLPPQLILETLTSIQYLLFPISTDPKSEKLLNRLVYEHGFDSNAMVIEGHIRQLPDDFIYRYWGERLLRLLDIVNNPPPANRFVSWFERHTSERNALTVATLGLFLTALLAFLSLVAGVVQCALTWVQYRMALEALQPPQRAFVDKAGRIPL